MHCSERLEFSCHLIRQGCCIWVARLRREEMIMLYDTKTDLLLSRSWRGCGVVMTSDCALGQITWRAKVLV